MKLTTLILNRIKRSFFTCASIVLFITTSNIATAQIKIGVQAGVNFSGISYKEENSTKEEDTQLLPDIRLGLTADFPITAGFYIQPGVFYATKGFKQEKGGFYGQAKDFVVRAAYVELPVNFLYKYKLAKGQLKFGAGAYAAYGTGGSWKASEDVAIGDIITDDKGEVEFRKDFLGAEWGKYLYGKPWDFGMNVLAGYEFANKITLQGNFQKGLTNLQPTVDGEKRDSYKKNYGFGVTIGYSF